MATPSPDNSICNINPDWLKENINLLEYILANSSAEIAHKSEECIGLKPCPICNHNDCFRYYPDSNSWYCYSTDHESGGSIIDFVMEYENLGFAEAMKRLKNNLSPTGGNKSMQANRETAVKDRNKVVDIKEKRGNKISADGENKKNRRDYSSLIERCYDDVDKTDYFSKRGISDELVEKYKLGYDKEYNAVTLPCYQDGNAVFVTKRIINPENHKYYNEGSTELFNFDILNSDQKIVYITEGIFDALSIEEVAGKAAIALNGGKNVKKLKHLIDNDNFTKRNIDDKRIIYVSDSDEQGLEVKDKMEEIEGIETKKLKKYKDANEYLQNNDEELLTAELIGRDFNISYLDDFLENLNSGKTKVIESGFSNLDEILQGGLFSGLYVIGAISSLGKTTFCLQMADKIAEKGKDVIYFSLEQSRKELISKSISREISNCQTDNIKTISTMDLLTCNIRESDIDLAYRAAERYKNTAQNLAIIEDARGVKDIDDKLKEITTFRNSNPVIYIDFLQILEMPDESMSSRQAVDYNLSELKRLSRKYEIPVFVISSFNRHNYGKEVSFKSFKESGSIEYTADVMMGLQLTKMHKNDSFDKKDIFKWKAENPRKIHLVILKYRNGPIGKRANFKYYPVNNKIEELGVSKPGQY